MTMKSKIVLAAVITALIMAGGYIERGWVDLPGTAAMLTLGVPLLLTWIHEDGKARPRRRRAHK